MPRCLRCVPLFLLLLLTACLEFDAQEITFRHDPDKDRIDALVVYRGLFVEGGGNKEPLPKALADLDAAMRDGVFCFWCNWPFKVDPVHDDGPGTALLPHYEIETGGLFTDPKGILCGYQFVRIREAKAFLQKVETLLEVAVQTAAATTFEDRGRAHKFDADSRDLLREFLRSGEKLLVVERGRIELRLPCTRRDHRWLKGQVEATFLDQAPDEMLRRLVVAKHRASGGDGVDVGFRADAVDVPGKELAGSLRAAPSFRFFWDNDFTLDRRDDLTTIGLGERGAEELRLVKASEGLYHGALLQALRERGDKIEDGVPDQELTRRFESFRGRDCVLPQGLAEKRAGAPGKDGGK